MKTKDAYIFFITLCMHLSLIAHSWHGNATYLFAPGLWSSEHQIAKYCSSYVASTGELVTSTHDFQVINGTTAIACNFPEIQLRKIYKSDDVYCYMIPGIVCTALLANLGASILDTSNNRYHLNINGKPTYGFSINPYLLNISQLNFGQGMDIKVVTESYKKIIADTSIPTDIILYGVSRGAVAAFNFIATEYAFIHKRRIKAIILESCFDSLTLMTQFSSLLSYLLPHYNHHGIAPINQEILEQFVTLCNTEHIPVLMISSLADQRVPYKNTLNLYNQLIKAGLHDIQLVTLEHSIHSGYTHDDINDTEKYLYAVHNFYKHYNLPYIPSLCT